jgi:V/A-type H+-transporting ATPase subunit D
MTTTRHCSSLAQANAVLTTTTMPSIRVLELEVKYAIMKRRDAAREKEMKRAREQCQEQLAYDSDQEEQNLQEEVRKEMEQEEEDRRQAEQEEEDRRQAEREENRREAEAILSRAVEFFRARRRARLASLGQGQGQGH